MLIKFNRFITPNFESNFTFARLLKFVSFPGSVIFSHYWFYGEGMFKGYPGSYRFGGFGYGVPFR